MSRFAVSLPGSLPCPHPSLRVDRIASPAAQSAVCVRARPRGQPGPISLVSSRPCGKDRRVSGVRTAPPWKTHGPPQAWKPRSLSEDSGHTRDEGGWTGESLPVTSMGFNILFPWRERGREQAGLWKNLALLCYVEDCGFRFLPPKYSPPLCIL